MKSPYSAIIGTSRSRWVLGLALGLSLSATVGLSAQSGIEALRGVWAGELKVQGTSMILVFNVEIEGGKARATLDSPNQGAKGLPVDSVSLEGGRVLFDMPLFGAKYYGPLSADGLRIEGTWEQGGMKLPLVATKGSDPFVLERPQEPKPPFPYAAREIAFASPKAGIELAGTLVLPPGKGPFPALVLVSGSGPQDRDEALLGHKPFLVLADYLARRGIASLRYDDRGVGASGGNFASATTVDFADDAEAAFECLATLPETDAGMVGIVGHSEGGLIAPIVASRNAKVAFIGLLAGPGLTGREILFAQGALIARASGASEADIAAAKEINSRLYAIAMGPGSEAEIAAAAKEAYLSWIEAKKELSAEEKARAREAADQTVAPLAGAWFRSFLAFDPAPYLAALSIPVLALNGSKDLQVPAKEDLAAIRAAIGSRADTRNRYLELPGLNHLFQAAESGSPSEYGQITQTMAPEAMAALGDWILSLRK